jgi:hypothetical protein
MLNISEIIVQRLVFLVCLVPMSSDQCCGSVTFWCGSGSGSWSFVSDLQDDNVFLRITFEATLASFFKDKNVFLTILNIEGSWPDPNPYLVLMDPDPDPGGPKTCWSGSATLLHMITIT